MSARKDGWASTESHHSDEDDPRWRADAACRDTGPALFFPARGDDLEPAKAVCRSCPVADACLEYALSTFQRSGVWGGYSERERRRMRSVRRGAA